MPKRADPPTLPIDPAPTTWAAPRRKEAIREILDRITHGEPATRITRDRHLPSYTLLQKWIRSDPKLQAEYRQAREIQAQLWVDSAMELAQRPSTELPPEVYLRLKEDQEAGRLSPTAVASMVKTAVAAEMQRRRLLIDTVKWFAGKVASTIYGEASERGASTDAKDKSVTIEVMTFRPKASR